MSTTLSGLLVRRDHCASDYDEWGRLRDVHSFDIGGLTLGAERVPVDIDHDGHEIGEVIHVERTAWGDIHAVAVAEPDELAELDQPIYFSARWSAVNDNPGETVWFGRNPVLLGVGLTFTPAMHGARPLKLNRGDVRTSSDRAHWSVSWRYDHPLLERASRLAGMAPLRIHDDQGKPIRQHPAMHRPAGQRGADGMRTYTSAHHGRILSVS